MTVPYASASAPPRPNSRAHGPPTPTNTASPDQTQGPGLAPYGSNAKSCPSCRHRAADPRHGGPVWLTIAYNPPHTRPRATPGFPLLYRNCPFGTPIHPVQGGVALISLDVERTLPVGAGCVQPFPVSQLSPAQVIGVSSGYRELKRSRLMQVFSTAMSGVPEIEYLKFDHASLEQE